MVFDYSKLLGRMKEKQFNQEELAKKIRNTPTTLSLKLNNKANFKQSEISVICDILDIGYSDIGVYFFNSKV